MVQCTNRERAIVPLARAYFVKELRVVDPRCSSACAPASLMSLIYSISSTCLRKFAEHNAGRLRALCFRLVEMEQIAAWSLQAL